MSDLIQSFFSFFIDCFYYFGSDAAVQALVVILICTGIVELVYSMTGGFT